MKKGSEDAASPGTSTAEEGSSTEEQPAVDSFPMFTSLIPPPPTLISETIGRYKEKYSFEKVEPAEEEKPAEEDEQPAQEEEKKDDDQNGESSSFHRVGETTSSSTYFTSLNPTKDFYFF